MRKHHVPIGWPQRNSRRYRFPIPNLVWDYQLKPTEFVILSYLCYYHSHVSRPELLSVKTVAHTIHMTVGTVKKYLLMLMQKGLITGGCSLTAEFQRTPNEKFFTLPNQIFLLTLSPSAFMVYAYLLLIEDRRTHTCHPSYNTIAADTGMSKNTVIKSVGTLLDKGLITMEHSRYIDQRGMKWKGNNLYTLLPIKRATDSFYQQQFYQMKLGTAHRRLRKQQATGPKSRAEI